MAAPPATRGDGVDLDAGGMVFAISGTQASLAALHDS
jgi:hypothetical protein